MDNDYLSNINTKNAQCDDNSEIDWKSRLTPEQFYVCRQQGTEQPFNNAYYNHKENGFYACVCCDQKKILFSSDTKYDSNSGWPSFYAPISETAVSYREDHNHAMRRTEVVCSTCHSHLGHVFDDGPMPTGKRFCMNSTALKFYTTL